MLKQEAVSDRCVLGQSDQIVGKFDIFSDSGPGYLTPSHLIGLGDKYLDWSNLDTATPSDTIWELKHTVPGALTHNAGN